MKTNHPNYAKAPAARRVYWLALGLLAGLAVGIPSVRAELITGASAVNVSQWLGSTLPTVGSKVSASSIPVVIASDQGVIPENQSQIGGVTISTGNGVVGTGVQRVAIASDNTAFSVNAVQNGTWNVAAVTGITNALPAGTNTLGAVVPPTACGTTKYESVMAYVPSTSTQVTATATCVLSIYLSNTDTVAHQITVQDQSTACNSAACVMVPTFSLPANSIVRIPMDGAKFVGGLKWQTDTANKVAGDIIGLQ